MIHRDIGVDRAVHGDHVFKTVKQRKKEKKRKRGHFGLLSIPLYPYLTGQYCFCFHAKTSAFS